MFLSLLGGLALILSGIAGAVFGLRVRDQAATRARLQAYHADLRARAERRMADAEAGAPADRNTLVRELRGNGQL
jgi:hypothetical protein